MTTFTTNLSITERILIAFPSGSYCLPALLSLAEIVETNAVPTAAVECKLRPKFLVNPEWVEVHAASPQKLMMLTMHELHHVILGHTRLYPRITAMENVIFDAVINSMLCHLIGDSNYHALFTDFYSEHKFPECLLRPPSNWLPGQPIATPKALLRRRPLADLYKKLYSPVGATYDELREALESEPSLKNFDVSRLMGDHRSESEGASSSGGLEARSPAMLAEVRRIVENWPRPKNPIVGRALHQFIESTKIQLTPANNQSILVGLLRKVAGDRGQSSSRHYAMREVSIDSPIPRLDRRSAVLRSLNRTPLLFRDTIPMRATAGRLDRVHVYLDVSGSVNSLTGLLYSSILSCRDLVHPVVHLFSNSVVDATLSQLRAGFCQSTGGTSIDCVCEHMHKHQVRRAAIITDGFVGTPGANSAQVLQQMKLAVALTPGSTLRQDLEPFVNHWAQLHQGTQS